MEKIFPITLLLLIALTNHSRAGETPALIVTTAADVSDPEDGLISLREAIAYSAADPGLGGQITFDAALEGETFLLELGHLSIGDNVTIIGIGTAETIIDGNGAGRVFYVSGQDTEAELRHLTITGGKSPNTGSWPGSFSGGAIYNHSALLILKDVTVTGNASDFGQGGGIYNESGHLRLIDTRVDSNSAYSSRYAGGIQNRSGVVEMLRGSVSNNAGGGFHSYEGTFVLEGIRINGNNGDGASIACSVMTAKIANCEVCDNTGSGLLVDWHGVASVTNSTLHGNSNWGVEVGWPGVGEANATVANSIISGNGVGGLRVSSSELSLTNSFVFQKENALTGPVQGSSNRFGIPPLFVDESNNDYRLQCGSHAIEGGDSSLAVDDTGSPLVGDIASLTRIVGNHVDIGAHEYQGDFALREEASTVVTSNLDVSDACDGVISLREALIYVAADPDCDTVLIDNGLAGQTVLLDGRAIEISESCRVDATSSGPFTVDAQDLSRVLTVVGQPAVEIAGVTFTGGSAQDGAGIHNAFGSLTLFSSRIVGNRANSSAPTLGGGVYNGSGSTTLVNSEVSGNFSISSNPYFAAVSAKGGGIYNDSGVVTLQNVLASGNTTSTQNSPGSSAYGGGIYQRSGVLDIVDCQIRENTVTGDGNCYGSGICLNQGTATVRSSKVADNTFASMGWSAYGGGVYSSAASLSMAHSVFRGNHGAGIFLRGQAWLINSLVFANTGPGLTVNSGGSAVVRNSTLSRNMNAGLFVHSDAAAVLDNTIVALNAGDDVQGEFSGMHNLIGEDPLFVASEDADFRLTSASPAVDTGVTALALCSDGNPVEHDLDGRQRVQGASVDIGAFEFALQGFLLWADQCGLSGEAHELFIGDRNGDGVNNGFEYAYGPNLEAGGELLKMISVAGQIVVELPEQHPDTLAHVEVRVMGSYDLVSWEPITPSADALGDPPDNRHWYQLEGLTDKAFYKLEGVLLD